jgi:hypothetical protein
MSPDARRSLATFLAERSACHRGVVTPEDERGGSIGMLVRGGCPLAPESYLFSVIDRAIVAELTKLPSARTCGPAEFDLEQGRRTLRCLGGTSLLASRSDSMSSVGLNDEYLALRVANFLQVVLLFLVGFRWAGHTGVNRWRAGFGIVGLGVTLVAIAIALGG